MFISNSTFTVIALSIAFYWLFYVPVPEECGYGITARVLCTIVEGLKTLASINFVFGGKFAAPFTVADLLHPLEDSQLTVTYRKFAGVEVALVRPNHASETEGKSDGSAIVFIHGGGFTIGSINAYAPQIIEIAKKTGILVIAPKYRLAPEHPFPAAFDDCLAVTKELLKKAKSYGVNPRKVALMGDSAGGNLAAAVALAIGQEKSPNPICMINLIYPSLQIVNFRLPSYRQNPDRPVLDAWFIMRFVLSYIGFGNNTELAPLLWKNAHMQNFNRPEILERVDEKWVPKRFKMKPDREYIEIVPEEGYETLQANLKKIQDIVTDIRLSSLLAEDSVLKKLPRTHIATCEFDPLRDDGVILHERMKHLGLQTSYVNWEFCIHSAFGFYGLNIHERLDSGVDDTLRLVMKALESC